jgi:hypothetical protein
MKKCKECNSPTKITGVEGGRCFNCEIIVEMMKQFEKAISLHKPIIGKPRKLEILKYKITRL